MLHCVALALLLVCPWQAENVLLDEKDEPVVADFGLATASEEEDGEKKTGIQGTLGHIAPGQLHVTYTNRSV